MPRATLGFALLSLVACGSRKPHTADTDSGHVSVSAAPASGSPSAPTVGPGTPVAVAVPGAQAPASFDYLAYDPVERRVWLPAGGTGTVMVLDATTRESHTVAGFATTEREVGGKARRFGPTAVSTGAGRAFVGNRGANEVCVVDAKTLARGACAAIRGAIDGVMYVQSSREVWVTTPHEHAVVILDASNPDALTAKTTIAIDGEPEGYGEDAARSLFFTNVEDKDRTLAIDTKTHAIVATWSPECGKEGPRGLAVDPARRFVVVACTDHLRVLDAGHKGAPLGRLPTGAGVDNIDFVATKSLVVAAAGKAATLTSARLLDNGDFGDAITTSTAAGARNVVADADGNAYVADPQNARLLVVPTAR